MDGGYFSKNGSYDITATYQSKNEGSTNLGEDLPMLCETCMGQNPYLRMVKLPCGHKLCKISGIPYQGFRWKAGPSGRHKETIISFAVAKERNICQACLNDMTYGVPSGLRDKLFSQSNSSGQEIAIPKSDVGLRFHYEQQRLNSSAVDSQSQSISQEIHNLPVTRQLDQFSRSLHAMQGKDKTAFRNLPKMAVSCHAIEEQYYAVHRMHLSVNRL